MQGRLTKYAESAAETLMPGWSARAVNKAFNLDTNLRIDFENEFGAH